MAGCGQTRFFCRPRIKCLGRNHMRSRHLSSSIRLHLGRGYGRDGSIFALVHREELRTLRPKSRSQLVHLPQAIALTPGVKASERLFVSVATGLLLLSPWEGRCHDRQRSASKTSSRGRESLRLHRWHHLVVSRSAGYPQGREGMPSLSWGWVTVLNAGLWCAQLLATY